MSDYSPMTDIKNFWGILTILLIFGLSPIIAFFIGENTQPGIFLGSSATIAPFVILAVIARFSMLKDRESLKYPIYLLLVGIILVTASVSFFFGLVSLLPPDIIFSEEIDPGVFESGIDSREIITILLLFLACAGSALISLVPLLRGVRVYLASKLDFDPFSRLHIVALVTIFAITIIPLVPVTVTGVPPYLSETFTEMINSDGTFLEAAVAVDLYTLFWTILASFAIAGLFTKRNLGETLHRLGLTRPGTKEIVIAVGFALILVAVFYAVDEVIAVIWTAMGWPLTDSGAFEQFLVPYMTLPGIVIASVCAGFGEEISIRGVLQPRFGIIIPAILFASLHAFQYNWDGIISVFIAGLVFGLIRGRYSTTVCAITHTTYDFVLFLGLLLGFSVI
ncbi:MAG: CPBP family intramembrane metalloprotease [Methanomicrobiaceae archaeon]|nr:CPBP family intramembrane metalloprotease [Methanomicrobiaceae archaeon]